MKILVLGGTGAIGGHVCRLLAKAGLHVTCTTRSARSSSNANISYVKGNAKDLAFLDELLHDRWAAIVDFMVWSTPEFQQRCHAFLSATEQYIFTSSYRVYSDSAVITEESPRLLDTLDDRAYLETDEYALCKARCENILFESDVRNWTIIRPAITYDGSGRFQLGVHESRTWLWRALNGIAVPMPDEMLEKQATISRGEDVARLICLLVGNSEAMGEVFTVATSEHHSWREISEFYSDALPIPLKLHGCRYDKFNAVMGNAAQIRYDRMYDRVIDNAKVLGATGLKQDDFISTSVGLRQEIRRYLSSGRNPMPSVGENARLDRLTGGIPSLWPCMKSRGSFMELMRYVARRCCG